MKETLNMDSAKQKLKVFGAEKEKFHVSEETLVATLTCSKLRDATIGDG